MEQNYLLARLPVAGLERRVFLQECETYETVRLVRFDA